MEISLPSVSVCSCFLAGAGFIEQAWIATAVVVLFNYLLLFQLLALYHAFDYQYLYPTLSTGQGAKGKRLAGGSPRMTSFVLLVELVVGLITFQEKTSPSSLTGSWFGFY